MGKAWLSDRVGLVVLFVVVLILALVLEFSVLPVLGEGSASRKFVEHIAISLLAASVLGLAFELVLYEHRKNTLTDDIREFRDQALATLKAMGTLAPREVFDLIRDIASAPQQTPTLYQPSRSPTEYNFVEEGSYFDKLIPVARSQVVEVLRAWVHADSHRNMKFLASDFVGKYLLHELAHDLRVRAENKLKQWDKVPATDRDWVLNFLWAASRCEKHRYETLGKMLTTTPDEYIQKWILFVPQQMPDREFVKIIDRYLRKNKRIGSGCIKAAILALAALQHARHDAVNVIRGNAALFIASDVRDEIRVAWEAKHLDCEEVLGVVVSASAP